MKGYVKKYKMYFAFVTGALLGFLGCAFIMAGGVL